MLRPLTLLLLLSTPFAVACGNSIGDACASGLDCSTQGSRLCDLTQPGGYCTLPGCESGTCPDEAVCVLFRPDVPRLSTAYCMLECEDNGDCREDEGYRCLRSARDSATGEAEVLDGAGKRYCALPPQVPDDGALQSRDPDAAVPTDAAVAPDAMMSSMTGQDAGSGAGADAGSDAGADAGSDAGADAGASDAGRDSGADAQ